MPFESVDAMTKIRLRYLVEDVDRHGNVRCYVRLPAKPKVRIRGMPGSAEFMVAYHAALSQIDTEEKRKKYQSPAKGSFGYVCLAYYASATFKALDPSTQDWRRHALEVICENHGDKAVSSLQSRHIRKLRDELADQPATSKKRLKALRALFRWAIEEDEAPHDPTFGVKAISYQEKGHHTWTLEEVQAFERRHPIGTKARLAMALMLYTTCRREDVVRLGPQHVRNGRLQYTQAKNEHRKPVKIDIPVHAELQVAFESIPSRHLTFLVTEYGHPFSHKGFGQRFKDWCYQAGLPHCSSHGLRKATATHLAEAGCTAHEIMAITGHKSLREVERYTQEAQKRSLADSGMSKFKR
jgi:integrase/recombinase XerD